MLSSAPSLSVGADPMTTSTNRQSAMLDPPGRHFISRVERVFNVRQFQRIRDLMLVSVDHLAASVDAFMDHKNRREHFALRLQRSAYDVVLSNPGTPALRDHGFPLKYQRRLRVYVACYFSICTVTTTRKDKKNAASNETRCPTSDCQCFSSATVGTTRTVSR
jgi:hypothetical protein